MVDGKISYVFSGDDDIDVIIPLPFAFLRLIASGIYTYDINWYGDDWNIDNVTSEQLSIVESALATITRYLAGERYPLMNFIDSSQIQLFSETYLFVDGYKVQIVTADLPADAQDANGLYLSMRIDSPVSDLVLQVNDLSGKAVNFIRTHNSGINRFDVIAPMTNGGFQMNVLNVANGQSVTWSADLIGWW